MLLLFLLFILHTHNKMNVWLSEWVCVRQRKTREKSGEKSVYIYQNKVK